MLQSLLCDAVSNDNKTNGSLKSAPMGLEQAKHMNQIAILGAQPFPWSVKYILTSLLKARDFYSFIM